MKEDTISSRIKELRDKYQKKLEDCKKDGTHQDEYEKALVYTVSELSDLLSYWERLQK